MAILVTLAGWLTSLYQRYFQNWINSHWMEIERAWNILKTVAFHSVGVFVVASFCLYISSFLFGALYFYNMPTIYHSFDLNFQYNRKCIQQHRNYLQRGVGKSTFYEDSCFPKAYVDLGSPNNLELLKSDQPYSMHLALQLPESQSNLDIGMFMVSMKCGQAVASTSATLKHKPLVIKLIWMLTLWPLLMMNLLEDKQTLHLTMFDEIKFGIRTKKEIEECLYDIDGLGVTRYVDCRNWIAKIELDYPDIQLYSAQLHVTAQFSGLQYFMFQWPVFSFVVGTSVFFVPVLASVLVIFYLILFKPYQAAWQALAGNDGGGLEASSEPMLSLEDEEDDCTSRGGESASPGTGSVEMVGPSEPMLTLEDGEDAEAGSGGGSAGMEGAPIGQTAAD